ncbi:MAG: PilZ domain-containing protein [Treponema sp.]|nr:PilZ domain-containing protein [Treponema sp.]MBQ2553203.1 PilZ domain-containing protein [Treponema sp.]
MSILIAFLVAAVFILLIARFYSVNDKMMQFFSKGLDSDFRFSEICTLWSLAKKTQLEDPLALFVSLDVLNKCIVQFINESRQNGTENSFKTQNFLTRLYNYRTRITLDSSGKRGIDNTAYLDPGQRFRVILSGKGVFASKLLSNGTSLVLSLPKQEDKKNHRFIMLEKEVWKDHTISVYFWRKGDAGYAFDSKVFDVGVFQGQEAIFLDHSSNLVRTQKRQSVRVPCNIYAQMYFIKENTVDYNSVNTDGGFRCLLEDISEDGALIRIGGYGKGNIRIKLQFDLNGSFIMMYGVVRGVEYNKDIEQSRLHFECTHIDPSMKNAILAFVYNVLPEEEKEKNEAMSESENDEKEDEMEKIVSGRAENKPEGNTEFVQEEKPVSGSADDFSYQPESTSSSFFGMGGVSQESNTETSGIITMAENIPSISQPAFDVDMMPQDTNSGSNPKESGSVNAGSVSGDVQH